MIAYQTKLKELMDTLHDWHLLDYKALAEETDASNKNVGFSSFSGLTHDSLMNHLKSDFEHHVKQYYEEEKDDESFEAFLIKKGETPARIALMVREFNIQLKYMQENDETE